ncbi:MAG: sulfatase-like hydrolase/transferase [Pseudomonadota bacterium]|nr:sulfatase-like hydrolase/transferase [Pseudomonadota bacterium]
MLLALLACTSPPDSGSDPTDPADDSGLPALDPTDTFPSFYGEVPKNLLVVSIDTFRRDLMARYGGEGLAPFLDGMAEQGVTLDQHRSCANWTFPSVLCFNHGTGNIDAGYVPDLSDPDNAWAPEDLPTLATRLSDGGWRTMLVTSNSWFSMDRNTDVGFETSERPDDRRTESVFGMGLDRLGETVELGSDRWYLHLHIKEPHPSYNPPEAYLAGLEGLPPVDYDLTDSDEQYDAGDAWPAMSEEERAILLQHLLVRYHGEVQWMSDQLIQGFLELEQGGYLDDTLVVFWTDHGEQFWEHGEQTHAYGLNVEENDAVAFFWAKNIVPGQWDGATSHIDLAPTILSLLGVPSDAAITGYPAGEAPEDRVLDAVSIARHGAMQSVVKDGWKLVYRWQTGERWLYDTTDDPAELTDLYDPAHPRAVELEAALAPRIEALVPLTTRYTPG